MANEQNLIPLNRRPKSEQREIARMGGVANGKARRMKKHGRELMRALLALPEVDAEMIAESIEAGVDSRDITNEVVMQIRQVKKAKKTADTAAFKEVNRLAGYLDEDEAKAGTTVNITVSPLSAEAAKKWGKQ